MENIQKNLAYLSRHMESVFIYWGAGEESPQFHIEKITVRPNETPNIYIQMYSQETGMVSYTFEYFQRHFQECNRRGTKINILC